MMAPGMNPLIGSSPRETAENVVEAFGALMNLLADSNSGLCRLLGPIEDAIKHQAWALEDAPDGASE